MRSRHLRILLCGAALGACSGSPRATSSPTPSAPAAPAAGCASPPGPPVDGRFAVGVIPSRRIDAGMADGYCMQSFSGAIVEERPEGATLVAPGTFTGACDGGVAPRTYQAVRAEKVVLDTVAMPGAHARTAAGAIELDHAHPEAKVAVAARPADHCGVPLETGRSRDLATFTPAAGCAATVSLVDDDAAGGSAVALAPLAAGTCVVTVEMLGIETAIAITVR